MITFFNFSLAASLKKKKDYNISLLKVTESKFIQFTKLQYITNAIEQSKDFIIIKVFTQTIYKQ